MTTTNRCGDCDGCITGQPCTRFAPYQTAYISGMVAPCCEMDHDGDGNCPRHRGYNPRPAPAGSAPAEGEVPVDRALALIDGAESVVSDLCAGRRRWTMSVPARPDDDPDLVIGGALHAARITIRALAARASEAEGLRGRVAELEGALRPAPLPASLHPQLTSWVVQPRHERGRADDAMLTVSAPGGRVLGTVTVGWLREHTDLPVLEKADAKVTP